MRRGEVRAVVDVERIRDAAHVPAGPGLAPDRLPERQRGGQRRRGAQVDRVTGDRPGVVVFDDGQPRPARPTRRGDHPQVQQGVIGLPDLVRLSRLAAVHQVEHLLVPLRALMREGGHRRVDAPHDVIYRGVARHRPPLFPGSLGGLPVHRSDGGRRAAQRQALDQQLQLGRHPPGSTVRARPAGQRGQPSSAVGRQPPAQRPLRNAVLAGHTDQRAAVLEVGAQHLPAGKRLVPPRRGQAGQPGMPAPGAICRERHTGSIPLAGPAAASRDCPVRNALSALRSQRAARSRRRRAARISASATLSASRV